MTKTITLKENKIEYTEDKRPTEDYYFISLDIPHTLVCVCSSQLETAIEKKLKKSYEQINLFSFVVFKDCTHITYKVLK